MHGAGWENTSLARLAGSLIDGAIIVTPTVEAIVADIPVDAAHPSHPEMTRIAEGVRRLRVPALILWGPRDPVFQQRYLDDLI